MEHEDEDKTHPGKQLAFRKRLLRMRALKPAAQRVAAEVRITEQVQGVLNEFHYQLERSWRCIQSTPNIPKVAPWVIDRGLPTRDMSAPLDLKFHRTLYAFQVLGVVKDVPSFLTWIRGIPDTVEEIRNLYDRFNVGSAAELAYFASIYLEILDGLSITWPCLDFAGICTILSDPFTYRRYAQKLLDAHWSMETNRARVKL